MKLITITGFPRTGTTWTLRTLLMSPDTLGAPLELGWSKLWWAWNNWQAPDDKGRLYRYSLHSPDLNADAYLWTGYYVSRWIGHRTTCQYMDDQSRVIMGNRRAKAFVEKTPIIGSWPTGWPERYIAESGVFDRATLIVCQRSEEDTWQAALRHYGLGLNQQFPEDVFRRFYNDFYEAACSPPDAIMSAHQSAGNDPLAHGKWLCTACGIRFGGVPAWTANESK